jgi:signal transduction histidine kinase
VPEETSIPHGATILGDVGLLERLFDNLLSNLQKHGDTTRPVTLRTCLRGESLLIEIENATPRPTGTKTTKKPLPESSSLGLKICACILELHGGRMETDANGETFTVRISLPVREIVKQNL